MKNAFFTENEIKEWCGTRAYVKGRDYYKAGMIYQLVYDPSEDRYDAVVIGSERYDVYVEADQDGFIDIGCTCPAFGVYDDYCKHAAAVLIKIVRENLFITSSIEGFADEDVLESNNFTDIPNTYDPEWQKTNEMISLFDLVDIDDEHNKQPQQPMQSEVLETEFSCSVFTNYYAPAMISIELKMGVQRLYVVQKIRDLLEAIANGKPYMFTKLFSYDPEIHTFHPDDEEVIRLLLEVCSNESLYRDVLKSYGRNMGNEKTLWIPPAVWERLWPKLKKTNVWIKYDQEQYNRLEVVDDYHRGALLSFKMVKGDHNNYILESDGVHSIAILKNYGLVLKDGVFYKTDTWTMNKIEELKQLFRYTTKNQLRIHENQMSAFIHRVVPGLKRLGHVDISQSLSDRIKSPPLQAKIYVDRNDNRLLVQPEFIYGDTIIRPVLEEAVQKTDNDSFLLRDLKKELHIMRMLEQANFLVEDKQIFLEQEEDIYLFLFHVLPKLGEVAEVFVTSSIQAMVNENRMTPKATLDVDTSTNLLEVRFDWEGIDEHEIQQILRTVVEKKNYYRMADGSFLSLEQDGFAQIGELIEQLHVRKSEIKGSGLQLPAVRALQLDDDIRQAASVKAGKALRQLIEHLKHPDHLEFELPHELESVLRDYQKYGFQWFKTLSEYRFGGILADDMGLGKTLQTITYILSEKQSSRLAGKPALIIAPASLVYNWKNECAKFAPSLKTAIVTGTKGERAMILEDSIRFDVIITSYPLIRRDADLYESREFAILVLDEAQAIKNAATQTAQTVKTIRAEKRFALTGTPIENSIDELWSIFDAVFPGLFPGKSTFSKLSNEKVARIAKPFILRRMKQDVLKELPDKIETVHTAELNKEQKKLYLAYLDKIQQETMQQIESEGFQKSRMKILAGLTRLRQLCCHPALFVEHYDGGSSKLEQLMELMKDYLADGRRMLIFSQFTGMLTIIRDELEQRGIQFFYLDGQTPGQERVELAERFNQGERDAFLISLKAGGTGLNLTGADTVILYDLWWNPAVEQQAADRAHRLGQKKVVQVIRLITEGTIEEKMHELQQKKKDLIDQVIQPGETAISSLSEAEVRELLMISS